MNGKESENPFRPLSEELKEKIRNIRKGSRPNPETYLEKERVEEHVRKFKNKATIFMSLRNYEKYVKHSNEIGYGDNTQYVMSTECADEILRKSDGKASEICRLIGWDEEDSLNDMALVRIDLKNIDKLNPRIPSGNEAGANRFFTPGGFTSGGIMELVLNRIPKTQDHVERIEHIILK